ncbi:acylphosphatase [Pedobacter nototheniae]|uniref:acylphosphatase n=1 Tax=Pedobacter nototheniae TaxID=2488994 RepID=UPI00103EA8DB|nr:MULTISPECIES: acylphosphatase [Pedobacter]
MSDQSSKVKHINIVVSGKVQGVFFRASTKAVADQMGIKGFVKNEKDGSVYIEAEAEQFILDAFIDWCKEGPEKSKVENVEVTDGEFKNYRNFEVVKKNLLW